MKKSFQPNDIPKYLYSMELRILSIVRKTNVPEKINFLLEQIVHL